MIERIWSGSCFLYLILLPLSWLYGLISTIIRLSYHYGLCKSWRAPVPVVIVGNLSAGGNGKTPMVIWLVKQLQQRGYLVGVVSRGYAGKSAIYPLMLSQNTSPHQAGDEPILIYKHTGAPVAISPKRSDAIKALLIHHKLDLVITDDGLQHYALQRDFELVMIDGVRYFGNGWWLPAGPMRERASRLNSVDAYVTNGGASKYGGITMHLHAHEAVNILSGQRSLVTKLTHVVAMAGISYPPHFFIMLKRMGVDVEQEVIFADHQKYKLTLLSVLTSVGQILLMTEKDAVKCHTFAQPNWWYLPVNAVLSSIEAKQLLKKIETLLIKECS